jgi:hypothetical protein
LQEFLTDAGALTRGQQRALLSFDEVRSAAPDEGPGLPGPVGDLGRPDTVGRVGDFDASFLPCRRDLRQRWARLDAAVRRGEAIPPIQVYELGGAYFVKDGHHRVCVGQLIREYRIREVFVGRPEADLFLWITARWL